MMETFLAPQWLCWATWMEITSLIWRSLHSETMTGDHGLLAAIMSKDELVQVNLELSAAHAVVGADQPLLQVSDGAVGQRYHGFRALAQIDSQRLGAGDVRVTRFW